MNLSDDKEDRRYVNTDDEHSGKYKAPPTPFKHYNTHRRNKSENIVKVVKSDPDSSRPLDKTKQFENVSKENKEYDYNRNEDITDSENEDSYVETDDEYNTVLHKYGMHRDGDKYRITR